MRVQSFAQHFVPLMLVVAATCAPGQVFADWPSSPLANVPLCSSANSQLSPVIATDGMGGAIIAWNDLRGGPSYDIYAQNVRSDGTVNINWPANGIAVCTATGDQLNARVVSEGSGGVIVAWRDTRAGTNDIYAQHVVASGTVDASWPVNGVAICSATGSQTSLVAVSDGSGGAIIAWLDFRSDTTSNVYAQHVLASGTVDSNWPVDGRALCLATGNQQRPTITSDGQGGAIVAWQDFRGGATADIYCSRVLGSGVVDSAWPSDGLIVCDATGSQLVPDVVGDSQHGALVSWYDFRGGSTSDIYVQHVGGSGIVDQTWPANGKLLCSATGNQQIPRSVSDGAGGAIVAWMDFRNAATGTDLYAQHIRADGIVDPAWPLDGRDLCTAFGNQQNHTIVQDGAGGAIVSWEDTRAAGQFDVYSHHMLASGAVDPLWPTNGRAICTAATNQQLPVTLADGSGGAVVAWADYRATGGAFADIYAQRVQADGQLGGSVVDVPVEQLLALTLDGLRPNPWNGGSLTLRFSLANDAAATLEVLDAAGRRVTARQLNPRSGGIRVETLELTHRLVPGVYFARLRQGPAERVKRFVVLE